MLENPIEQARALLQQRVDVLRGQLTAADAARNEIMSELTIAERGLRGLQAGDVPGTAITVHGILPTQFRGKRLAEAIAEYLESIAPRTAHLHEITAAMRQGSAKLGKQPGRESTVVKIAISTNRNLLTMQKNMVGLAKGTLGRLTSA